MNPFYNPCPNISLTASCQGLTVVLPVHYNMFVDIHLLQKLLSSPYNTYHTILTNGIEVFGILN